MRLQCKCGSIDNFDYTRVNINTNGIEVNVIDDTMFFNNYNKNGEPFDYYRIWDVLDIKCNECGELYELTNGDVIYDNSKFSCEEIKKSGLALVE